MQRIFTDIVAGDLDAVRRRLADDPASVSAVASGTPKKYAGQSTLQVAIRSGTFEIAELLVSSGADPGFIDNEAPGGWATPVLHGAVAAAVKRSRWLRPDRAGDPATPWRPANSAEESDGAFAVLRAVLEAGADARALDSKGNSALGRAASAARDVLPAHNYRDPDARDAKPLNPEAGARPRGAEHPRADGRLRRRGAGRRRGGALPAARAARGGVGAGALRPLEPRRRLPAERGCLRVGVRAGGDDRGRRRGRRDRRRRRHRRRLRRTERPRRIPGTARSADAPRGNGCRGPRLFRRHRRGQARRGERIFDPAVAQSYLDAGAAFVLVGADVALLARGSEALAARWIPTADDTPRAGY